MTERPSAGATEQPADVAAVRSLYQALLDSWNARGADRFAALFDEDGYTIGFDGSLMHGRAEIAAALAQIFAHHPTATYVGEPKLVRLLTPDTAVLRAVAGMVPPGQSDINPAVNTMQSLVTTKRDGAWRIVAYQNTPAQFHGRPELSDALTEELRQLL